MAYLEQLEAHANRHRRTYEQAQNATAVLAGRAVVDPILFDALARKNAHALTEADSSQTAVKDVMAAFSIAYYTQTYGPVSARLRVKAGQPVESAITQWNRGINDAYRAKAKPAAFRELFFEGGLWQVFIDRYDQEGKLRAYLEQATDFRAAKKHRYLQQVVEEVRPLFARTPPAHVPSHNGSHFHARDFANTVLHIGEREFGLHDPEEKLRLLENSLPEMRRPAARLELEGVNAATTDFLLDGYGRYHRKYLTIDDKRHHVGFDMEAVQDRVEEELPDVASYHHRGCPAIYQKTPYNDHDTPIFSVMETTLINIYQATGALSIHELRH